jgi:hypothetical protein
MSDGSLIPVILESMRKRLYTVAGNLQAILGDAERGDGVDSGDVEEVCLDVRHLMNELDGLRSEVTPDVENDDDDEPEGLPS